MPFNKRNSATTLGRVRITLGVLAALAVIAALLLGGLVALAQSDRGAVPNLRLSSAGPGELTISWDAPDPAPSDYRVIWAEQSLDFLSYKNSNEANRGNEYPSGDETSITHTGLIKGETFKVMARARYASGGRNNGAWSGPWTDAVTARVKDDPPAAPTGLTASQVAHDSVTISWTAPNQETVTGYRVLRGTDANSLSAIAQDTGSAGTEYTDSTVAAETTYYYAAFAPSHTAYSAQVLPQDARVTVAATAAHSGAIVAIAPTDVDTTTAGHQIDLTTGANTVTGTVTNGTATKTYTVTITRGASSTGATLDALTLSEGALTPVFSAGTNSYTATVKPTTGQVTVAVTATVPAARVIISPPDADADPAGHQMALNAAQPGGNAAQTAFLVIVTNDTNIESYAVTVTRAAAPLHDAALKALSLSAGTLAPAFAPSHTAYSAQVLPQDALVAVAATVAHSGATIAIAPTDADTTTAGHQVNLAEGANTIIVTVTAADGARVVVSPPTPTPTSPATRSASRPPLSAPPPPRPPVCS